MLFVIESVVSSQSRHFKMVLNSTERESEDHSQVPSQKDSAPNPKRRSKEKSCLVEKKN
jgi:hypothetical protein